MSMTTAQAVALSRLREAEQVRDAYGICQERASRSVAAAIRAADLDAARTAKARLARADDQLYVAEQYLADARQAWLGVRPRGSYGQAG